MAWCELISPSVQQFLLFTAASTSSVKQFLSCPACDKYMKVTGCLAVSSIMQLKCNSTESATRSSARALSFISNVDVSVPNDRIIFDAHAL